MSRKSQSKNRLTSHTNQPSTNLVEQGHAAKRRKTASLQAGGVLLSLAGVLACNYLGLGLGRVVCQGLLVAALGAPMRGASTNSVRC
ncbi:hypothetical protein [Pseudodesulfovibrio sp. zrk46]|uniref:hypothetical protein n=1 Tax=Pseudodesulfovibrio sp. zrk46 TaxID=2725288 RepID=UPI001449995C|nr:hypothetical protein [Pseudodesulfovibrio sp. zrk46]QJB56959.1 hypothetical protein HFN16_11325 [Pseudodesulfovibrio sp. zrk46]